jgi:hypothetical protein
LPQQENKCLPIVIPVESNSYNFGRIPQDQTISHEFEIVNISDHPVTIKGITTSCACTAGVVEEKTIEPDQVVPIVIFYSTENTYGESGKISKVIFTDPNICPVILETKAFVFAPGVRLSPNRFFFDQVPYGKTKTQKIQIVNFNDPEKTWSIQRLTSSTPLLKPKYLPDYGQITVDMDPNYPVGKIDEIIMITLQDLDMEDFTLELPVTGEIIGPLAASPRQLFWPALRPEQICRKKFVLSGPLKQIIPSAGTESAENEIVQNITVNQISPDKHEFIVSVKAPSQPGLFRSSVIIHTNNKIQPLVEIPVLGFVHHSLTN